MYTRRLILRSEKKVPLCVEKSTLSADFRLQTCQFVSGWSIMILPSDTQWIPTCADQLRPIFGCLGKTSMRPGIYCRQKKSCRLELKIPGSVSAPFRKNGSLFLAGVYFNDFCRSFCLADQSIGSQVTPSLLGRTRIFHKTLSPLSSSPLCDSTSISASSER